MAGVISRKLRESSFDPEPAATGYSANTLVVRGSARVRGLACISQSLTRDAAPLRIRNYLAQPLFRNPQHQHGGNRD